MPYIIGYQARGGSPISTADFDTASEAWSIAIGLQRGGQSIRFIRTPEGVDISVTQLKELIGRGGNP